MEYYLETKKLKKYYGVQRGIEDVSIKIPKGTIYGFVGPNGAGKSTTLRTIMGLLNQTDGVILIEGVEVDRNKPEFIEKVGYLPSEINLYGDMTVNEMLDYHQSFYKKDLSRRRKSLVKRLKLDTSKKICALSLGNLKKIGFVLSILHEPELLILDEPTSGLDPIMQNEMHKILQEERERGTTILYSSHILSEISSLCDITGFIKDGKMIIEDTIENIMKNQYTYVTIASNDINKIKKELNLEIKVETSAETKFINTLSADTLIQKLSKYKIDKLLIENIPLEDLFEKYYK